MSEIALLRPEMLLLVPAALLLVLVAALRLRALSRARRTLSTLLQALSALLVVLALAEPALVRPDPRLNMVVVLDASSSLSPGGREAALRYASDLQAALRPTDQVRFVAAGSSASVLTPEQVADGSWAAPGEAGEVNSTDLSAGLRLAGSLLADEGRRRVVLVTDGWETRGAAGEEAEHLRSRGIDLRAVPLTALGEREVLVEGLSMQSYARVGDPVLSDLRIYSTIPTTATMQILVDGEPASSRVLVLQTGDNRVPLEQKAGSEGFHRVEVRVLAPRANDTNRANNSAHAGLVVKPAPRVLVLEERAGEGEPLALVLQSQGMVVDLAFPAAVKPRVEELARYDAVVIVNVSATSFTLDQQRTLQEYVRRYGRGLVATGGPTAFGKGDYTDSVFEEVMPVSSKPAPRPQEGATALIMVLDRSASMGEPGDYNSSVQVEKFAMAIEAARLAVDALREGDTVGLVAFDDTWQWAVPVRTINDDADKDRIKAAISNIRLGNTTEIFAALNEAAGAMGSVNVPTRHLVLLTDGMELTDHDYGPLLDELRTNKIRLSTIGIGSDVAKDFLVGLARDGLGRYYFTEQPETIPQIVFKEIELATREATLEGEIQPHIAGASPALRGLRPQDLPLLTGYDITTAKDEAFVALTSDTGDPLLAHWQYGLGRVLAFTSEAGRGWGAGWLEWPEYARFWNQSVRWTMGSPADKLLQPGVRLLASAGESSFTPLVVTAESLNPDNSFADLADITAGVRSPSGVVTSTRLLQTAPGHYEAQVAVGEPGAYEVLVSRARAEEVEPASETIGLSVPPSPEYLHAGTNDRLLKRISAGADYMPLDAPTEALDFANLQGSAPQRDGLWPWFLAPALLLLLAGVAVRRVDFGRKRR